MFLPNDAWRKIHPERRPLVDWNTVYQEAPVEANPAGDFFLLGGND